MIDTSYLIALIFVIISGGWMIKSKAVCAQNYDSVGIYDTPVHTFFVAASLICLLISLIINWANVSFLSTLCYVGITIGVGLINGLIVSPLLIKIFGYSGIGAILPIIASIASIIWMFAVQ